jgi:hypothetical protein
VSVTDIYIEHSIRQRISYDALNLDYVVFCQSSLTSQGVTLHLPAQISQVSS